jgi:hypothetical protein
VIVYPHFLSACAGLLIFASFLGFLAFVHSLGSHSTIKEPTDRSAATPEELKHRVVLLERQQWDSYGQQRILELGAAALSFLLGLALQAVSTARLHLHKVWDRLEQLEERLEARTQPGDFRSGQEQP